MPQRCRPHARSTLSVRQPAICTAAAKRANPASLAGWLAGLQIGCRSVQCDFTATCHLHFPRTHHNFTTDIQHVNLGAAVQPEAHSPIFLGRAAWVGTSNTLSALLCSAVLCCALLCSTLLGHAQISGLCTSSTPCQASYTPYSALLPLQRTLNAHRSSYNAGPSLLDARRQTPDTPATKLSAVQLSPSRNIVVQLHIAYTFSASSTPSLPLLSTFLLSLLSFLHQAVLFNVVFQ